MAPAHPLRSTLRWFRGAVMAGAVGLLMLLGAAGVASARYPTCGPSRLDASEAACRIGVQLLVGAYAVLALALVLGAVSLSLLWGVRRRIREARTRR